MKKSDATCEKTKNNDSTISRMLTSLFKHRLAKHSYSQSGEDLIIDFVLCALRVSDRHYLDIGAHHPTELSNTYLFYQRGFSGVLVEADPDLCNKIRTKRPRDVCLNAGVGPIDAKSAPFYVMDTRTLSTFSKLEATRYQSMGTHRIERTIEVPVISLNSIIESNCRGEAPTVLSIDVEGLDFELLRSLDFQRFRPTVICVETLSYSETREEEKDHRIAALMSDNGYFPYADTYINTIFVETNRWKSVVSRPMCLPQ
jgi:FkbM family methyltransferase